jgi:acyl carrier protein
MKQIEKNLKIILGKFLNINPKNVNSKTNTNNNSNWDSLVNLNILIEVEKKFKIRFTKKEINELNSYANYIKHIDKKYAKLKK